MSTITDRFPIGTTVLVNSADCPAWTKGQKAEVRAHDTIENAVYTLYVHFIDGDDTERKTYWVKDEDVTIVPADHKRHFSLPENMTLDEARTLIELFENDYRELGMKRDSAVSRAERAEQRLGQQQDTYRHDMQAIQRIMLVQKSEQSWCDDGWNEVVEEVNDALEGGFSFDKIRKLVKKKVTIKGEVSVDKEVWVYDDEDDEDDPDNWYDEDGSDAGIDVDEALSEEVAENGFDSTEVNVRDAYRY
jgi:hypothetical protein